MVRKISELPSRPARCAWKGRPSTTNVTSLDLGLFTYATPSSVCCRRGWEGCVVVGVWGGTAGGERLRKSVHAGQRQQDAG